MAPISTKSVPDKVLKDSTNAEQLYSWKEWFASILAAISLGRDEFRGDGIMRPNGTQPLDATFLEGCKDLGFIAADWQMKQDALPTIRDCLHNSSSVFITGETGTGKEVVAKCIHELGDRKEKSFQAINCGGLPAGLLESELFGYVANAFSGASSKGKKGLVEVANKGTLFLDEIGDTPPELQVKLLRFLNDGSFYKVGGIKSLESDVRIIAATNKDPNSLIGKGCFRSDLYYRLNTMEIHLWPLYLRPGDIPLLMHYCINEYNQSHKPKIQSVGYMALAEAMLYRWPGNVRELKSRIERGGNGVKWQKNSSGCLFSLNIPSGSAQYPPGDWIHKEVGIDQLTKFNIRELMEDLDKKAGSHPNLKPKWQMSERIARILREKDSGLAQEDQEEVISESVESSDVSREKVSDRCFDICDLTRDDLLEKYERGILARYPRTSEYPRTGEAAKKAGVNENTIRDWRRKYETISSGAQ